MTMHLSSGHMTLSHARLEPIAREPWLRDKPSTALKWLLAIAAAFLLLTEVLSPFLHDMAPTNPLGMLVFFLMLAAVLYLCVGPLLLAVFALRRKQRQYCPDCLSYMNRGAHVCPFCGFRDDASASPSVAPQPAE
jgi:hypothetical protein